ncbi:uncharacterized protein N7511_002092 [Penicillium nucicola]|uniref:uncharacterized protein n=1 Tax=Penicillium nucicola TaxID=1850975 RepID=UPI002544E3EA|nr:uncharacterized protein N7511_002092 [Penicillium nucicola]KAJ5770041.1 hypothetical protein N7511_002092 [Penicillium nucicola]
MTTVPQGPVEARSLSSVTAIASNPPPIHAIPPTRNTTHCRYIFLSPLKPPTKSSVSAEAINASLYYLHVATPDDDTLLQEVEQQREEEALLRKERLEAAGDDPAQREFARLNNVRRKPVAGGETGPDGFTHELPTLPQEPAAPALPPRPIPDSRASAENVSLAGAPVALAQPGRGVPEEDLVDSGGKNGVQRRPLPPLPPGEESWTNSPAGEDPYKRSSRWSAFAGHLQNKGLELQNKGLEQWKERYGALSAGRHSLDSPRPQLRPRSSHDRTGLASPNRSPGQSPSRLRHAQRPPSRSSGFHITLIRRDPTSGTQWNVATISTPRMDRNAVDIEISTPGYNRFVGLDEPLSLTSLAGNLPPGLGRLSNSAVPQALTAEQPREAKQQSGPRKFHRQLCVSKPFDDTASPDCSNGHVPDGQSKLKSGYYVFTSPWNGTCTFASSVNGRSLKCKHMIPHPPGAVQPNGEAEAPPAVTVAELRFNTPFQAANLHSHAHHANHKPHPNHVSPFTQSQQSPTFPRNDINDLPTPASSIGPNGFPQPNYQPPDSDNSTNSNTPKRPTSFSALLNPNIYSRPRAHSGPGPTPSYQPYNPNINTPSDPKQPFTPGALLRRTSLRAQRFARQSHIYANPQGHPPNSGPGSGYQAQSRHNRSTSASSGQDLDYDSDEDRLDFSLARENAGGGLRGKSAKLGKLVIEDEGIKMLDLVVAACMAVWWRGYYY